MTPSMHDKYFTTGKQRPSQNDKLENGRVEPPLLSHISHAFADHQEKGKPKLMHPPHFDPQCSCRSHSTIIAMDIETRCHER